MSENRKYSLTTNEITIEVNVIYSSELSKPKQNKYVYIYKVTITNYNSFSIKLTERFWQVIEDEGAKYEVTGEGVIGKQPTISSQARFDYASQAILYSKTGIMFGKYKFINLDNFHELIIPIPAFPLELSIVRERGN